MSAFNAFRQRYLVRFWSPLPALVALGVASAYYFALTGTFWAVTGEFTRWGGHVLSWFGYQPQDWSYFRLIGLQGTPLDRIDGVMIIGMFLGALCCALWAGNVSLRWPTSKRRLLQGLAVSSPASARAWRWAATWRRSSPVSRCFPCTPGPSCSPPSAAPGSA